MERSKDIDGPMLFATGALAELDAEGRIEQPTPIVTGAVAKAFTSLLRQRDRLFAIVEKLAAMPVDGGDGYCGFCATRLDGREHPPVCLQRQASDEMRLVPFDGDPVIDGLLQKKTVES